ncbi:oxidoreductase [Lentzea pudingi]|uniref:Oxidoreductase n=1 Tax=Lentzea pudingi TaxID=1789439 RepID=A0ABQ2IRY1_9PSEU|nr:aldo/keto reductase [Lentzea pudingi]GGN23599.1 oxidoreductase [Lentzea pudingi]
MESTTPPSTHDGRTQGMVSRRGVLAATGAAALAIGIPGVAAADHLRGGSRPVTRPLPDSGGIIPVIGLGTFMTFDRRPETDRSFIPVVLREFFDGGGRVIDTSALYGAAETNTGQYLRELGLTNRVFLADKSWNCGEYAFDDSHAVRQFTRSQERLHRRRLDLVGVHSMTNVGMILPVLNRLKAQGAIRYVGLTSHEPYQYAGMRPLIETGAIDVIQVRYSMFQRSVEDGLLSIAADNGVAVMVNMALEKGRLHHAVTGHSVPRFAQDEGCESWAQYFLSYVAAHPAVTCVLPASTNPAHVRENLLTMHRPLPDQRQRRRMLDHLQEIPEFARVATTPWYPGKTFANGLVRLPQPHPTG